MAGTVVSFGSHSRTAATPGHVADETYTRPVSGSAAPPAQAAAPDIPGSISVPFVPFPLVSTIEGGVYRGPILYRDRTLSASALISGVKSITSSGPKPCLSN